MAGWVRWQWQKHTPNQSPLRQWLAAVQGAYSVRRGGRGKVRMRMRGGRGEGEDEDEGRERGR